MLLAFQEYAGNRWTCAAAGIVVAGAGAAAFYYLPLEGSTILPRALARFGIGLGGIMALCWAGPHDGCASGTLINERSCRSIGCCSACAAGLPTDCAQWRQNSRKIAFCR
jgi:hypothetical protein